ncbi:MAG: phenylalanine--tRNA ligase beta subunit-related protein [Deltaproteobacteria bacterium]
MPETRIDKRIFEKFPEFIRGIVVARKMDNHGVSEELEALLNEAIVRAATDPIDLKSDPNKFPPAHLALLKRVQKPGASIPFINKAVAIMNDNSIRGFLPVGGDDLNEAGQILELRPAEGDERFAPLNNPDKIEQPDPQEIIYLAVETGEVMCRRWNWRNGFKTRITEETQAMVMNIDGMGESSEERTLSVRDRVARMLEQFCGAEIETSLLTPSEPRFSFSL